jgi:hypothetical protein
MWAETLAPCVFEGNINSSKNYKHYVNTMDGIR